MVHFEAPRDEKSPLSSSSDSEVPSVYFNGFGLSLTNSDINVLLQLENKSIVKLHMSFTIAKTLHEVLGHVLEQFEGAAEHPIMTTREVDEALIKLKNAGSQ